MRLFGKGKQADERERMEMYRNEHYIFWFWFWTLGLGVVAEKFIMKLPWQNYIVEFIIFLAGAAAVAVLDLRDGHYDYHMEPGWRSYLLYAVGFSVLFTGVVLVGGWYQGWLDGKSQLALVAAVTFAALFVMLYAWMAFIGSYVKRRRRKLEEELDNEE